jgi:hypothetical protein
LASETSSVGEVFVSKIVAFACLAMAGAVGVGFAPWRSLMVQSHDSTAAILTAGGLFTVAIAVLIRD